MNRHQSSLDETKREAAERAAQEVRSGMVVGLGTGSTARFAVEAIGQRLAQGELENVCGIPTSIRTRDLAVSVGIPLTDLNAHPVVDLTLDGADEVDPEGNLIKGGGGALLREKIVASASRRVLIMVDETKLVARLAVVFPVPVEVVPFGWKVNEVRLCEFGADPILRVDAAGTPFCTDEGHHIIDCTFAGGIADLWATDSAIRSLPGVVETGLFLGMSPEVFVGRSA